MQQAGSSYMFIIRGFGVSLCFGWSHRPLFNWHVCVLRSGSSAFLLLLVVVAVCLPQRVAEHAGTLASAALQQAAKEDAIIMLV